MKIRTLLAAFAGLFVATAVQAANPVIVIETSKGDIKVELYEDKSPITVKNFLTYVDEKHFDGLTFHRVIKDFMIQGGGYDTAQKERRTHEPIKNESGNGVLNKRGYIAMARTEDLDSATSQFFINTVDNDFLDKNKYCAFGKVIDGMDVVDKIRTVETGRKGMFPKDCPQEDVVIKKVKRADK
ncbi:MAG TPA: peptidylprolyl isomerase [Gemmataceae bacterium]|jgi:cyclophilin family peptidyl-prolyl cis-trans isomerase|nr:peptidylprolyl isomerase [Gemmataceae bacterium]